MKVLNDPALLQRCIDKGGVAAAFEDARLPFKLVEFERGELLSYSCNARENLQFVVEGQFFIYALRENGSRYLVSEVDCAEGGPMILGDVEFSYEGYEGFLVEARSRVLAVVLPLRGHRERLQNDCVFLRTIMRSLGSKISLALRVEALSATLEERLMRYMNEECEGRCLRGVGLAAERLHCSRRQLQRLLARLCEEGRLEKRARGSYALVDRCEASRAATGAARTPTALRVGA